MQNRKKNENIEDIKFEIEKWRSENKKKVEIILFPGENDYLIKLGIVTKPLLFEITDKDIQTTDSCPNFIKHKYFKKNKKLFRLKKKERDLLDSQGIKYKPLGYIVYL